MRKQRTFWQKIQQVPDMQAAWLLLLYCAVLRANHLLRSLPPNLTARYAADHDNGIWDTFLSIVRYQDWEDDPDTAKSRLITCMPVIHGGLGLRSSKLIGPAAYWAAWADILPIIVERLLFGIDSIYPSSRKSIRGCIALLKKKRPKPRSRISISGVSLAGDNS